MTSDWRDGKGKPRRNRRPSKKPDPPGRRQAGHGRAPAGPAQNEEPAGGAQKQGWLSRRKIRSRKQDTDTPIYRSRGSSQQDWTTVKRAFWAIALVVAVGLFIYLLQPRRESPIVPIVSKPKSTATSQDIPVEGAMTRNDMNGSETQSLFGQVSDNKSNLEVSFYSGDPDLTDERRGLENWISKQEIRPLGPNRDVLLFYLSAAGVMRSDGQNGSPFPQLADLKPYLEFGWEDVDPQEHPIFSLEKVLTTISDLRADGKDHKIIVLLDVFSPSFVSRQGNLDRLFPLAVQETVEAIGDDNLFVIVSRDLGQENWSAPELGGSVFAYFAAQALYGRADEVRGKSANKKVALDELVSYLQTKVSKWTRDQRGSLQTPWLAMTNRPADDPVALDKIQVVFSTKRFPEPAPISDAQLPNKFQALEESWDSYAERNPETLFRVDPAQVVAEELLLSRREQLAYHGKLAGTANSRLEMRANSDPNLDFAKPIQYLSLRDWANAQSTESLSGLEEHVEKWFEATELAAQPPAEEGGEENMLPDYTSETLDRNQLAWVMWQAWQQSAKPVSASIIDESLAHFDQLQGSASIAEFSELQFARILLSHLRWTGRLLAPADDELTQSIQTALRCHELAAEVNAIYAPRSALDQRAWMLASADQLRAKQLWLRSRIDGTESNRRKADDVLLSGDVARAKADYESVIAEYEGLLSDIDTISKAYAQRDRAAWLWNHHQAWLLDQALMFDQSSRFEDQKLAVDSADDSAVKKWQTARQLCLDLKATQAELSKILSQARPADIQQLQTLTSNSATVLAGLAEEFKDRVEELRLLIPDPENTSNLDGGDARQMIKLCESPLLSSDDRSRFHTAIAGWMDDGSTKTVQFASAPNATADAVTIEGRESPTVSTHVTSSIFQKFAADCWPVGEDTSDDAANQERRFADTESLRRFAFSQSENWRKDAENESKSIDQWLAQSDLRTSVLKQVAPKVAIWLRELSSPDGWADLRVLMGYHALWRADQVALDMWGVGDNVSRGNEQFFAKSGGAYRAFAEECMGPQVPRDVQRLVIATSTEQEKRAEQVASWLARLALDIPSIEYGAEDEWVAQAWALPYSQFPTHGDLTANNLGCVASVSPSGAEGVTLAARLSAGETGSPTGMPMMFDKTAAPPDLYFSPAELDDGLDVRVSFRGHQIQAPLTPIKRLPPTAEPRYVYSFVPRQNVTADVKVDGEAQTNADIVIVLDCSNSMNSVSKTDLLNRKRFEIAKESIIGLLEKLRGSNSYRVALMAYGHRYKFGLVDDQNTNAKVISTQFVFKRDPFRKDDEGKAIWIQIPKQDQVTLHPSKDVELLHPRTRKPTEFSEYEAMIGTLKEENFLAPVGFTPLYYSILEAAKTWPIEKDPIYTKRQIIVLTDGNDEVPGGVDYFDAAEKALKDRNAEVDVILFRDRPKQPDPNQKEEDKDKEEEKKKEEEKEENRLAQMENCTLKVRDAAQLFNELQSLITVGMYRVDGVENGFDQQLPLAAGPIEVDRPLGPYRVTVEGIGSGRWETQRDIELLGGERVRMEFVKGAPDVSGLLFRPFNRDRFGSNQQEIIGTDYRGWRGNSDPQKPLELIMGFEHTRATKVFTRRPRHLLAKVQPLDGNKRPNGPAFVLSNYYFETGHYPIAHFPVIQQWPAGTVFASVDLWTQMAELEPVDPEFSVALGKDVPLEATEFQVGQDSIQLQIDEARSELKITVTAPEGSEVGDSVIRCSHLRSLRSEFTESRGESVTTYRMEPAEYAAGRVRLDIYRFVDLFGDSSAPTASWPAFPVNR